MDSFGTILSLYDLERQIFHRMIFVIGMEPKASTMVIGFWLSLEWLGYINIIQMVATDDDTKLTLVAAEAQAALAYIESEEMTNPSTTLLSLTSDILNRDFTLDHFYTNRQVFREGIERVLEGVCNLILRDILDERGVEPLSSGPLVGPINPFKGETSSLPLLGGPAEVDLTAGSDIPSPVVVIALPAQTIGSNLNPMARPYTPEMARVPLNERTLFVTFSHGDPLTEEEIRDFFTGINGDCVEDVFVHQPTRGGPALFGKVYFRSAVMIEYVMNGFEVVKITAVGKPLWCRRFDPRNQSRWRRAE
ncbi:uncharacterized protein LOC122665970 [Telopea speciosissima]|uniref:uncharacterized protein LOC122665970 n=1 Tax=Telopea speciosissima TaxID=54955 RepID=UPI001CC69FF6|nr:uncharacterized protein LOC122665970 [Telopea speciosissima]